MDSRQVIARFHARLYIAVSWIWVWHAIMHLQVARHPTFASTQ
jgi:hypothetical protein